MEYFYSTWSLFVEWIRDCRYNFSHLPPIMKVHLRPEDEKELQNLVDKPSGKKSLLIMCISEMLLFV